MIYPMFALILLTFAVAGRLLYLRIRAVKTGQVRLSQFRLNQGEQPDNMVQAARNYSNLFEVPVLFYTGGVAAIALGLETTAILVLAWLFVACRLLHSWIHLTNNNVITRLRAFLAGNLCVLAIWLVLIWEHVKHSY